MRVPVATVDVFVVLLIFILLGLQIVVEESIFAFGTVFGLKMRWDLAILGLIGAEDLGFAILWLVSIDLGGGGHG